MIAFGRCRRNLLKSVIILTILAVVIMMKANSEAGVNVLVRSKSGFQFDLNIKVKDTNGKCGSMMPTEPHEQVWFPVDANNHSFVYAAYAVETNHEIIVIAAAQTTNLTLYCQFWTLLSERISSFTSIPEPLKTFKLGEGHELKYAAVLYKCPMKNAVPTHVSITTNQCGKPLHLLPVVNATKQSKHERTFTVCLKPLNFEYGRAYELIEWVEMQKLLGVEKIVVYNYSIASNIDSVLRYYSKQGLVEVIQWHLPMRTDSYPRDSLPLPEIHSVGQIAVLQDCLLRNRQYSEFVVHIDSDEFIIPRQEKVKTWKEMLKSLPRYVDAYMFMHVSFRKEWISERIHHPFIEQAKRMNMVTLQILQRESKKYTPGKKSKYFIRTYSNANLWVHEIRGIKKKRLYMVPENIGASHHYRNWGLYDDNSTKQTDTTILDKYAATLVKNVEKAWRDLQHVTMYMPYVFP